MVTTKSGKAGKVSINLDIYYGFQNVTKKMDMLNAEEFVAFSREAFNNNYVDRVPGASPNDPLEMRPAGNRYRYPAIYDDPEVMAGIGKGTDWQAKFSGRRLFKTIRFLLAVGIAKQNICSLPDISIK